MSEMWMDVDVGLAEVPVNIMPLLDDTDFKSREVSIAYNAAGMDLVWNFVTPAGAFTQTAVTPTTGGNYDWAHQGDGMYSIEIPASGGASINNDTEGFGWFTGFVTGVLPWRGPVIGIRAAALNDALIEGGDVLDVNVAQWLAQAVTLSVGNKPDVNVNEVSDDSTAADNLEAQYDTTGVSGDTFPATQLQVSSIGSGSAGAVNIANTQDNIDGAIVDGVTFVGVETSGTNASVNGADETYHNITGAGTGNNFIDIVYQFDVGGARTASSVIFKGRLDGANDSLPVEVWNGSTWDQISVIDGQAPSNTTDIEKVIPLLVTHTGTGANLGEVYIRIHNTGAQTGPDLFTDMLLVQAVNIGQSIGYADGALWYDDSVSNTSTEPYVDATADNPVSSWAAIKSLVSSVGLDRIRIANGSTVTLDANTDNYTLVGDNWDLALGSQSIVEIAVRGAHITGIGTAASGRCDFADCLVGAATLPPSVFITCGIGENGGQFTAGSAGEYVFDRCYSMAPGVAVPALVFTGLGSATGIHNRGWKGGAAYTLDANCTLSHEVLAGGDTTVTTGGGDAEVRGVCRSVTFVLSAAETVQFVGVTGPITLSGTTTATVNLYGVSDAVADSTSGATVTDATVSQLNVADETLKRGVSNVEDAADTTSLAAVILAILESSVSGTTWTIRKTGGGTFVVKTITVDSGADPITGVT